MKKNDPILALATLAYSYLFYNQNAGINFPVFTIILLGLLLYRNKALLQSRKWLWAAGLCLVSGLSVFLNSSALSILANCFSLLLVSAFSVNAKTSTVFAFLSGVYSMASSFIFILVDATKRLINAKERSNDKSRDYKFLMIGAVAVLCILFFILYRQSNLLFAENTKWLNLDFLSPGWLIFTIAGGILVYGFFNHRSIPGLSNLENTLILHSKKPGTGEHQFKTEIFAGVLLFSFLNFMLLVLNTGDMQSFWLKGTLPEGVSQSDFVHNGIGIIIFSIVLATGLVMFLFRRDVSDLKQSRLLKLLVFAWAGQNLLMLCSTAYRNRLYIQEYDLTYKRIGVYVWLFLAAIGLALLVIKVAKDRSNWYLVKANFTAWFTMLAAAGLLNWDVLITRYNIANKPLAEVDFYYLFSLSDANIPELIAVRDQPGFEGTVKHMKKNYQTYYSKDYNERLNDKINAYLRNYTASWQSFDLRDQDITTGILNR